MTLLPKKRLLLSVLISSVISTNVNANDAVLTERVDRLERIIQGQGLVSLLGRVDQLQREVQKLHGENESLRHEIDTMAERQRQLYLDIDQRLEAQKVTPQKGSEQQLIETKDALVENNNQSAEGQNELTDANGSAPLAPVAVESGEAAYQSALQILRSGEYEQAISALSSFPTEYPNSRYLPNAYYWQGEANYVLRHFEEAIKAFQMVIEKYPASTKVADATLKMGFSQYELGQLQEAKSTLQQVLELYPTTSASRLAKVRLDRINKQNQ